MTNCVESATKPSPTCY